MVGELPEQVPYLEWKHSAFAGVRSCQTCHMPVVEGEMAISSVVGHPARGGVAARLPRRQLLHAENAQRPPHRSSASPLCRRSWRPPPSTAETPADRCCIGCSSSSTREVADGTLQTEVVITNLAGHKLPSAYPSRRAWLHLTVRDASGEMRLRVRSVCNPDGSIRGNDNDAGPSRFEPHHTVIDEPEQVQIYEAIMGDPDGAVTTVLLSAVRYIKDNRLLPDGFDKATADEAVAVHGSAEADENFVGGRDRIGYVVDVSGAEGPFIVDVELVYQPIGYRWAHNLGDHEAEEIERFIGYYEEMADRSAVVLASAKAVAE